MSTPLQFVVLRHEGIPEPHYDLMLELKPGGPLTSWRLRGWPLAGTTPLTPLPDHRRDYLTYEGPLSGDRGVVRRVASGTFDLVHQGRTMLIVRLPGLTPDEWIITDFPGGSVAVPAGGGT